MSGAWILLGAQKFCCQQWGPLVWAEQRQSLRCHQVPVEGSIALEETHFDPFPFLAQDCKACLCSSWLVLQCQESVEVKNPKGRWKETFLCLWTDFNLEQMLCQKAAVQEQSRGFTRCWNSNHSSPLSSSVPWERRLLNVNLHSSGMFRTCPCLSRLTTSVTDHGVCPWLPSWDPGRIIPTRTLGHSPRAS